MIIYQDGVIVHVSKMPPRHWTPPRRVTPEEMRGEIAADQFLQAGYCADSAARIRKINGARYYKFRKNAEMPA